MAQHKTPADPNMATRTGDREGLVFRDASAAPFALTGFPWFSEDRAFFRLPAWSRPRLREKLAWVAAQPSGGMVRFRTDSRRLSVRVRLGRTELFANNTLASASGIDVYIDGRFTQNLSPAENVAEFTADLTKKPPEHLADYALYLPLLNPVEQVEIGLAAGAALQGPKPYAWPRPIAFYGSSITQGFCASRPALTYPARICRALDAELINLGFGGNAKGDTVVAEAIAGLDLACLVLDYDHNCDNLDHLRATHEPFFRIIRDRRPTLPVVFVTSPVYGNDPAFFAQRAQVIRDTYDHARTAGDTRVWFVHGKDLLGDEWRDATVDNLHPNDAGFAAMTEIIGRAVREALSQMS